MSRVTTIEAAPLATASCAIANFTLESVELNVTVSVELKRVELVPSERVNLWIVPNSAEPDAAPVVPAASATEVAVDLVVTDQAVEVSEDEAV